jgi:hypothetical protein
MHFIAKSKPQEFLERKNTPADMPNGLNDAIVRPLRASRYAAK